MTYKKIADVPVEDLKGKKILVRVDFNVPVADGVVADDFRIKKSLPTISLLQSAGARIVLISHIESVDTLKPVCSHLSKLFPVVFCEDCLDDGSAIASMKDGDIVLCENIRLYSGEKTNDVDMAKQLASLADLYVNDAFSVSHRKHASVSRITEFLPSYAGLLFDDEVRNLSKCFNPARPFLFILGGAKFETKIPLISKFKDIADTIFVGGALAHNFFKEQGREIGQSLVSEGSFGLSELIASEKIILPVDAVVLRDGVRTEVSVDEIIPTDSMLDNGSGTVGKLAEEIKKAQFILWNGPLGNYENGYTEGTLALAKAIAATETAVETVVGGGDTLAAIAELHNEEKFTFISTAGGAMLDFLANGTLPGIKALEK